MSWFLIIVAQSQPDLFQSLKQEFAQAEATGRIEVILDRRQDERRQLTEPHEPDRRGGERRADEVNKHRPWWLFPRQGEPPPSD